MIYAAIRLPFVHTCVVASIFCTPAWVSLATDSASELSTDPADPVTSCLSSLVSSASTLDATACVALSRSKKGMTGPVIKRDVFGRGSDKMEGGDSAGQTECSYTSPPASSVWASTPWQWREPPNKLHANTSCCRTIVRGVYEGHSVRRRPRTAHS